MTTDTNIINFDVPLSYANGGTNEQTPDNARFGMSIVSNAARNFVIGGNFDTNPWQRGTTFSLSSSGLANEKIVTADRFILQNISQDGTIQVQRGADAPNETLTEGVRSTYCLEVNATSVPSLDDSNIIALFHCIEGMSGKTLFGSGFTLSFWVKADVPGIYAVSIGTEPGFPTYVLRKYTISEANVWQKIEIIIPRITDSEIGTWFLDDSSPAICWGLLVGPNYADPATTTWTEISGNLPYSTGDNVNPFVDDNHYWKISLIQVELGSGATRFGVRSEAEELKLCKRYYQKSWYDRGSAGGDGLIRISAKRRLSTTADQVYFEVPMWDTPAVNLFSSDLLFSVENDKWTWQHKSTGVLANVATSVENAGTNGFRASQSTDTTNYEEALGYYEATIEPGLQYL